MRPYRLKPVEEPPQPPEVQTPRSRFLCWCVMHPAELAELSQDMDYALYDRLWPEIARIFALDAQGYHQNSVHSCNHRMPSGEAEDNRAFHVKGNAPKISASF